MNKHHKLILLIGLLFGLISILDCKSVIKQNSNMENIQLQYADGSGNIWKINSMNISYHPVKPEMSSSGIYSGGVEASETILESDFTKVYAEFEAIFKNKAIEIKDRIMTSGVLTIQEKGKAERKTIIKAGKEQLNLEALLNSIIAK